MSINNAKNDYIKQEDVFSDYNTDVSFYEYKSRDEIIQDNYPGGAPIDLDYALNKDFNVNLNFLKNQSFSIYNYIETSIQAIEKLLLNVYLNPTLTPNLEESHSKLWEELCKYNSVDEAQADFVCFEEYMFAERSMSTVARRLIAEFNQVSSQSVFSYLLNFRSLLKAMLNEAFYIKNFIMINFPEEYEDDSQKEVAIQFDAWSKVAAQSTQRIMQSITTSPGEIPVTELDQVSEKQAVEFQAFFSIRLESINEEVINLLNALKRDYVDNCSIFYDRYLTQSLNFKTKIVSPMELNYYTTVFSSKCPSLTEELVIATNVMNANFGMVLTDLIQRNQIIRSKVEKIIELVEEKRKYSNYIYQLSYKGQPKKIILKTADKDDKEKYSQIYKQSYITYKDQSDLISDHGSLHNLTENHHPQYLLRDGGIITGDITVENGAKIDGISLSKHGHTGADGSVKIKSTDIDYDTPREEGLTGTPLPTNIEITDIKQDIIDGGIPVVDAILSIEVSDTDSKNYEYEVSIYEV